MATEISIGRENTMVVMQVWEKTMSKDFWKFSKWEVVFWLVLNNAYSQPKYMTYALDNPIVKQLKALKIWQVVKVVERLVLET